MIEYELDIPSLTNEGIQLGKEAFYEVIELNSSSMIDELIMIEMLILLIDLFNVDMINVINIVLPTSYCCCVCHH